MPAAVDKDAVRLQIMKTFQECAMDKPLPEISLRDVAKRMGVTHASLLYYFENKDALLVACSNRAGDQFSDMIRAWFSSHKLKEFDSLDAYLGAFFEHTLDETTSGTLPRGVVMTCAMGAYSESLWSATRASSEKIRQTLQQSLCEALGCTIDDDKAQTALVLLFGIYFCAFNGVLTEGYTAHVISSMKHLLNVSAQ